MLEPCLRTSPFRPGSGAGGHCREDTERNSSEARAPWLRRRMPGLRGAAVQASVCPGGRRGFPSPWHRVAVLLEASFPPASSSGLALRLAQLPGPLTPPALPPNQQSSGGWRPPREPRAGLAAAVQGSFPARRNSRHSGWPCGSAWRTRPGFEGPETAPATGALAGLPPLVTEAAPARPAPQLLANQGAARSRIGQAGGKRSVRRKIPPRAAAGAERGRGREAF